MMYSNDVYRVYLKANGAPSQDIYSFGDWKNEEFICEDSINYYDLKNSQPLKENISHLEWCKKQLQQK